MGFDYHIQWFGKRKRCVFRLYTIPTEWVYWCFRKHERIQNVNLDEVEKEKV